MKWQLRFGAVIVIIVLMGSAVYSIYSMYAENGELAGANQSLTTTNGLELIYIDDRIQKDGCITIKTFHRQHTHLPERFQNKRIKEIVDGEKVYYQDGEPCDIPEGTRLDVRVQMLEDSVWNVRQGEVGE
ncbi:hypothetical protein [Xenorhabdus ishibashii]|uniref:Peptidase n=1 Tax=Xenorhabdus ishibashii TaxID=1034471 RepID=A0A2D0KJI8_9GAMM|nr:hypothetical protein [Xenorhabdus ishibashii]PHM63552.1 peptidase [Xenorhabdus ishibashii]